MTTRRLTKAVIARACLGAVTLLAQGFLFGAGALVGMTVVARIVMWAMDWPTP
jgi:hypothetical protein